MFRRRKAQKLAAKKREALTPFAVKLGLDPSMSFVEPPISMEAKALYAYRVGALLLDSFSDPMPWPGNNFGESPVRRSLEGAQKIERAMASDRCLDAVAWITHGFGQQTAAGWSRAAASGEYPPAESEQLRNNATQCELTAQLAAEHWPVNDTFGALTVIDRAASERIVDPDNPNAMVDLHSYFGRAAVTCGAIGLALGPELDQFSEPLYGAVWGLDVSFATMVGTIWNHVLPLWANLLQDEPRSYMAFMAEEHATS